MLIIKIISLEGAKTIKISLILKSPSKSVFRRKPLNKITKGPTKNLGKFIWKFIWKPSSLKRVGGGVSILTSPMDKRKQSLQSKVIHLFIYLYLELMGEDQQTPPMVSKDVSLTYRHQVSKKPRGRNICGKRTEHSHDSLPSQRHFKGQDLDCVNKEYEGKDWKVGHLYKGSEKVIEQKLNKLIARVTSQKALHPNNNERGRVSLFKRVGNSNSYKSLKPSLYNDGNTELMVDPGTMKSIWESSQ